MHLDPQTVILFNVAIVWFQGALQKQCKNIFPLQQLYKWFQNIMDFSFQHSPDFIKPFNQMPPDSYTKITGTQIHSLLATKTTFRQDSGNDHGSHRVQLFLGGGKPQAKPFGAILPFRTAMQLDFVCSQALHGCTISHNITNMENHFPEKRFLTYSQVYRGDFWMQLLGGECPKRTSIWSNSSKLANCLNLGQLLKHVREGKTLQTTRHSSAPLLCTMHITQIFFRNSSAIFVIRDPPKIDGLQITEFPKQLILGRYQDGSGRARFAGVKANLKKAQRPSRTLGYEKRLWVTSTRDVITEPITLPKPEIFHQFAQDLSGWNGSQAGGSLQEFNGGHLCGLEDEVRYGP